MLAPGPNIKVDEDGSDRKIRRMLPRSAVDRERLCKKQNKNCNRGQLRHRKKCVPVCMQKKKSQKIYADGMDRKGFVRNDL